MKETDGDVDEEFMDENKDHENPNEKANKIDTDQLLGVEQAILQSIDTCSKQFLSTLKSNAVSFLHKRS